ncbi:PAS domain S-box protein [Chloroflexota bacterium]
MRNSRRLTSEEKELLALIGIELGVAVEKARFYMEAQRIGREFQEIFEKAHDAILIQDLQGKIAAANQASSKLFGYKSEELIGKNISQFLTPQGLELAREVRQIFVSGKEMKQPYEQRIIKNDGTEAILLLTTSLLGLSGDIERPLAFQHIARDITGERRLQENLRLYADQISRAYEEERTRIARELHDDTIQTMVAVSRRLDSLADKKSGIPQKLWSVLEETRRDVDESLIRTRRFIQDLRPPTLEYLGLLPALRELVTQWQEQSNIEINLRTVGADQHFSPEKELLVYRIVQEALRNIWKHSEATKAEVVIEFGEETSTVTISDNGKGFNDEDSLGFLKTGKLGLAGMKEISQLLGGTLTIHSINNGGTRVILDISNKDLAA